MQSPIANSSAPSPIANHQSSIINHQSVPQSAAKPRRKIHPILSRLTRDQKQQLVLLYEQHSAKDASRLAQEKLGIQISTGLLSRLYSTWQIAEDNDTRADLEAAHNTSIETLTEKQLQLRLLERASRPNIDDTELRVVCQSFARLQSVKLSERRVLVAEKREVRMNQIHQSHQPNNLPAPVTQEEMTHYVKRLLGKEITLGDELLAGLQAPTPCGSPASCDDEALTDSAVETCSNPSPSSNPEAVGPVAPV